MAGGGFDQLVRAIFWYPVILLDVQPTGMI